MGGMTWESGLIPGRIRYVSVHHVHISSVTQKSSYPVGNEASLGIKQPACEPYHLLPSRTEVKNVLL